MASKTHEEDDLVDMDSGDNLEMEETDQYDPVPVTTLDAGARRRRIEELMEEKQLKDSIFGDMDW